MNIDTEWQMSAPVFEKIVQSFGTPLKDLFATYQNYKCNKYVSWQRDPYAFDIDAFTLNWNIFYFYAFPPFSLILKCFRKIINDEATGVLVVSYWPSQPWYPLLSSVAHHQYTSAQVTICYYHLSGPSTPFARNLSW